MVVYQSRGLCYACHKLCVADGTLIDYPLRNRRRQDVLQDYREIRQRALGRGITKAQVADIMGMTLAALDQALHRARKDGVQI